MRKYLFLVMLVSAVSFVFAQNFEQYFENKTVRIDYKHIGNSQTEKIEVVNYHVGAQWEGTVSHLVEPKRLGGLLFEVFDALSGQLIYSRSCDCLFNEYRTTERGEKEIGTFEECVRMPMPKGMVKYKFTSYDRHHVPTELYQGVFDPQSTACETMTKQYKVKKLHIGGQVNDAIDILLIPDGYAASDKKKMQADFKRFTSYIMNCSPYKEMSNHVNIRAIEAYSEESGITNPNQNVYKKTLLNCSYNVIDLDRYLMCLGVWKMNEIADDAPYDFIIILCNSDKYGGGGIYNFYCTVNNVGAHSDYVIVHEMGHLIGGLADEYYTSEVSVRDFYPEGVEPVEPNLTTLVDFGSKWLDMLAPGTPVPTPATKENQDKLGVYEGGGYVAEGVFRPMMDCTMHKIMYNRFCPVCLKALQEAIMFYSK